jgi:muconolactone delta-isomerase
MEYLVAMTTHVPDGTSEAAVDDVRAREAVQSKELAEQGRLLRLWRPPVEPGEWRTLGLFHDDSRSGLDAVVLSMPLRVWRSDEVVPLSPLPNDPAWHAKPSGSSAPAIPGSEFFTTFTLTIPPGTPTDAVDRANAREADRARELAALGVLLRLWSLPGHGRTLGLWRAGDALEMDEIIRSLPLRVWTQVETIQLAPHPSDPGRMPSASSEA